MRTLTFCVEANQSGKRLDRFLTANGISMSVIRRAKRRKDGLTADGKSVYTSYPVSAGEVIGISVGDLSSSEITPCNNSPCIIYEDDDLLVCDKPAGLTVHPCSGNWDDSLGARIVNYYNSRHITADFHPIQRLDKGTDGLMVVAKHPACQCALSEMLHTVKFRREYDAVCMGTPEPRSGIIDLPLGRSDDSYIRQCVREDGKSAVTHYETTDIRGNFSRVHLRLETGRTHQIRVHMAYIGHPLVGDFLYGTENTQLIARPALHSAYLSFEQPFTRKKLEFESPLPDDMEKLLYPR